MSLTPPHPALGASDFVSTLLSWRASLPFRSLADLASVEAHKAYYVNAPVLHSATTICGVITVYVYVMQMITGNASQVDGLWTFLPLVYSAHFTFHKAISHYLAPPSKVSSIFRASAAPSSIWDLIEPRLALMFLLQVCWSARLTFNAHRRGMFKKGEEDYRWPLLRAGMSTPLWHIFSFVFIAVIQNILLAATALPQYQILSATFAQYKNAAVPSVPARLVPGDFLIASLLLINLALQFGADHEQWVYQNFKRGKDYYGRPLTGAASGTNSVTAPSASKSTAADGTVSVVRGNNALGYTPADAQRGFVTKGLWAYSRHPNFACEQATWWILWLYVPLTFLPTNPAVAEWRYVITYAIASPLIMNILFIASTLFSESVSAEKYPAYAAYQRRVGMFLPIPDTLVRSLYYRLVASKEARAKTEADVWGTPVSGAKDAKAQ